jgi:N-ethylmaleimide reductase
MISPATVGTMSLQHKVVMSPMTRTRMAPVTEVPTDLTVLYHGQRTTPGGLIISECAYPCKQGRGYVRLAYLNFAYYAPERH